MNLFEKLSAIQADLPNVAKNLFVGEGKSQYKAVGEADVLAAVKPLENKYKVYSYPFSRKVIDKDIITTTSTYRGETQERSKFFMRVETVYRFVDIEKPSDYIDITTYGDGIDSGDKAPGKAMTYGDKYALLKAYKIITGEDPDQVASEDGKTTRNTQSSDRIVEFYQEIKRTGVSIKSVLAAVNLSKIDDLRGAVLDNVIDRLRAMPDKAEAVRLMEQERSDMMDEFYAQAQLND